MRRHISLVLLATFLGVLTSLFIFIQARAQIDAFTFFIPFPADQLDDLFDAGSSVDFIDDDIVTTISIAVRRSGTVIYYDHWEDGLEVILTSPGQSSTQVWGDGDLTNGIAPTVRQPNPDDTLQAGDIIALQNTVELPRDSTQFFFDGGERGDKLTALGGAIAVSVAVWPESVSSLYAGAWALGSTSLWGMEYVVPVGEDIAGTGPNQRPGFQVVGLNVQAVLDNTVVDLDLDGDGSTDETVTLDQGEQYTTETGGVEVGARVEVQSGGPVQVHILTADPDVTIPYEARAFTLLPLNLLADEYLAPRSSDGDHWLHNPHSAPITVTATTATDVTIIAIPANSTVKFPATGLSGPTGVHFEGTDTFYGVAALDPDSARDWGYGLAPVGILTTQALVGWAPGNNRNPPSSWGGDPAGLTASRVYVTALTTTTLNVIYDLSITPTQVVTFPISPLEEVDIFDPNDYDMTGAVLYTTDGVSFAAVWGQHMTAPVAQPSIDVGTGIVPLASMAVQKTITLIDDADGSGDISWGDTLRFEIFTVNNTNLILRDAVMSDTLPSTVDYVRQSSTVRSVSIPDDTPPRTSFPFDEGGYPIGDLQPNEAVTATFDAIVRDGVEEVCNTAGADSPSVPPPGDATACVPAVPPIVTPTPTPLPPTPTPTPEPPDTPEPPPPPTATPGISLVTPEPTLPVLYLPETGSGEVQAGLAVSQTFLLLVACAAILGLGAWLIQKQAK